MKPPKRTKRDLQQQIETVVAAGRVNQRSNNQLNRRIDDLVKLVAEHDQLLDVIRDNSGNYERLANGVRVRKT